jgi:hypothetical protein
MAKFNIYRADINKTLLTIEKPTAEEAFGAWASAAMVTGFLPMRDSATKWIGGNVWECKSSAGKVFSVEAVAA